MKSEDALAVAAFIGAGVYLSLQHPSWVDTSLDILKRMFKDDTPQIDGRPLVSQSKFDPLG